MSGGSAQPATGVTLRRDLTEMMEEITFPELNLTGEKILPSVPVVRQSGQYPVLPREARMKVPNTRRSPDGTYPRGSWQWNQDTYACFEYGFEEVVDNVSNLENAEFMDQEKVSSELAVEGVYLGRESRVATAVLDTAVFTGATNYLAITNEWDDATNATPWANIDAGFIAIRGKCGLAKKGLSLVLTDDVFNYCLRTDEVKNSVLYTEAVATMSDDRKRSFLADYFGIKEIIQTSAIFDTSALNQDAVIGKFWSNEYAMLAYLSPAGSTIRNRGLGIQPVWSAYSSDLVIESYPEPQKNSEVVRAREYRGTKINSDYGFLFGNMKTTVSATTGI